MPAFDLIQEAQRLIRFNTVTTQGNTECAYSVGRLLHRLGFRVQYQEYREHGQVFLNVMGMLGDGSAPPLLLAAHLDTVDPGNPKLWTKTGGDPWRAVTRGDALYGLGSADDKVDLLCKILAATRVKPQTLTRPILLLGTFGEERGLLGAARFCQGSLPRPAMALVGEPSGLQLVTRHKGLLVGELALLRRGIYRTEMAETVYELEVQGAAAHSSTPEHGDNAILRLLEQVTAISQLGTLRLFGVEGGTAANIVPARCTALLTVVPKGPHGSIEDLLRRTIRGQPGMTLRPRRLPSGWHPTLPWADLMAYLQGLDQLLQVYRKARDRAFAPPTLTSVVTKIGVIEGVLTLTFDVRALPGQDLNRIASRSEQLAWTLFGPPGDRWQFRRERQNPALDANRDAPVVRLMLSAMRAAKVPAVQAAKAGCSEAGWYQLVGIPSVVFGPGQAQGNIHQPNEHNSLRQIRRAVSVYEHAIERACVHR